MKALNTTTVEKTNRPIRVIQFGEGNFLRAFVDWQIDVANDMGVTDMGIVVVQPRNTSNKVARLQAQDNMYHVYLEGLEKRQPTKDIRLVRSIMDSLNPYLEYSKYESYITSPDIKLIISNTTEAGIRYDEGDDLEAQPPKSFPAKITALLYKRFQHFKGDPQMGLSVICCELIEENGTTLHKYIRQHAEYNHLGEEFIAWLESSCCFCDTLVDRIVPGFPTDTIDQIKEELGYDDNLVVKGELYHLWAIGGAGYERVERELPLHRAGLHTLFMPSIKQFRDKKVRILNGSHTAMVPIALQMGCESVMDAFNTPSIERFVNNMVAEEIIPMIDEDQEELKSFASSILERFYNPFIKHLLTSIVLNSLSKWEARNYPTLKDLWTKHGKVAHYQSFTFAALLSLYSGKSGFEPNDTPEYVEFIKANWDSSDLTGTVAKIVGNREMWMEDFNTVDGFVESVAEYLGDIESLGMDAALDHFLAQR